MAEPNEQSKNIENAAAPETKAELPNVESPPLSPGHEIKSAEPEQVAPPAPEIKVEPVRPASFAAAPEIKPEAPQPKRPSFIKMPKLGVPPVKLPQLTISRRLRNGAALAATVMIAAGLGAAVGSAVNKRAVPTPVVAQPDNSLLEDNHAMQKSIARLTKELAALKTSVEAVSKDNRSQIAKISEKLADREKAPETTGSIAKSATAPTPPPAPATAALAPPAGEPAPLPTPRPAIVQGWTIREVQNGAAWLEFRGDLYRAVPGIPLPGLGHVEAIRRDGNQWVVVTSKGVITTASEASASNMPMRPRPYYPPYYRPY